MYNIAKALAARMALPGSECDLNFTIILYLMGACLIVAGITIVVILWIVRKQQQAAKNSKVDPVTGLIDFERFKELVPKILSKALPNEYTLICLDIQNFKYINNAYDYDTGNRVLKWLANFLQNSARQPILLSRDYADDFVILVKSFPDSELHATEKCVCPQFKSVQEILGEGYRLYFSVGMYEITNPKMIFDKIYDAASLAKKKSKETYGTCVTRYNVDMHTAQAEQKEMVQAMEKALDENEFTPYLQPKFLLTNGKLVGAELLARWISPVRGMIMPMKFIPLFERNGFIVKLDLYMFKTICRLIAEWKKEGKYIPIISVNFSRHTIVSDNFIQTINDIVKEYDVQPNKLELELTENVIVEDFDKVISVVIQAKQSGFIISMDDFGSGYSSLNKLKDLPVDVLKIDKGFLSESIATDKGKKIVGSVISMSKTLGLVTVAEGVETIEQAAALKELGCDVVQGFLYARPMTISDFKRLLNGY